MYSLSRTINEACKFNHIFDKPLPKAWCHVHELQSITLHGLQTSCATKQSTLQWRHNEDDGVSNHQPHDCLLNGLFKAQIKENIKAPRHWPFCRKFTGNRWITRTMANNAENVSIEWRHHELIWRASTSLPQTPLSSMHLPLSPLLSYPAISQTT